MKKKIISNRSFLPILLSGLFLLVAAFAYIEVYSDNKITYIFNKKSESVIEILVNKEFKYMQAAEVQINMDTLGKTVNAVQLVILYDPEKLKFVNFDTSESFCQFYPEKKVNESIGEIRLSCGSPKPGFSGENIIAKIQYTPIQVGVTDIVIQDTSMILLNDGKGSNVLHQYPEKSITIMHSL